MKTDSIVTYIHIYSHFANITKNKRNETKKEKNPGKLKRKKMRKKPFIYVISYVLYIYSIKV